MKLDLTQEDARMLVEHLGRRLHDLDAELVRTDAPKMQHALARDGEKLRALRDRIAAALDARAA